MASLILFCLTFLVLSCSISLCTVDIFQSQDRSTCYGMKANLTCITVVAGGLLRWSIDGNTVFTVGSGLTASFNQTVDGSTFVFVKGTQLPGQNIYTYTSTVSLDTNKARSISCSDGILPMTFDVDFIVEDQPADSSTSNNGDHLHTSVIISWNAPADAGICCDQYHVVSSNGTTLNTTATSFTLYNITTQQEHDNAFISVRCMDQVGTMGPEAIYRPVVSFEPVTVSNPEHVGFSGNMSMYEVGFNLPNSSGVAVSLVKNCSIDVMAVSGSGSVVQQTCDLMQNRAFFTISDLSPFRVLITVDYELGFGSTTLSSPINGDNYDTRPLVDASVSENRAEQITALEGRNTILEGRNTVLIIICVVLGVLLLIMIIIIAILILVIIFKPKPTEDYSENSTQESQETNPNQESVKM